MNDLVLASRWPIDTGWSPYSSTALLPRLHDGWTTCSANSIESFGLEPLSGFTKATANAWPGALEAHGLGSVSIARITAVRKVAVEAADFGLLAPETWRLALVA